MSRHLQITLFYRKIRTSLIWRIEIWCKNTEQKKKHTIATSSEIFILNHIKHRETNTKQKLKKKNKVVRKSVGV